MNIDILRTCINNRVGHFLKESRRQAGLSVDRAAIVAGYASAEKLRQYEENGAKIPCCELVRLAEKYRVSHQAISNFLTDLQIEIYKLRRT